MSVKQTEFIVEGPAGLQRVARFLLDDYSDRRVIAFHGAMGAGKTTLISVLCRLLGAGDSVCSPTFTIINEYVADDGSCVYHFDFYRLKSAREAFDTGAQEYLNSGSYCFVEWPEAAPAILPDDTLHVTILHGDHEQERRIIVGLDMPAYSD